VAPRSSLVAFLPARHPEAEFGSFLRAVPLAHALARRLGGELVVHRGWRDTTRGLWRAYRTASPATFLFIAGIAAWVAPSDLPKLARLKSRVAHTNVDISDRPLWQAEAFGITLPSKRKDEVSAREQALFELGDTISANAPEWMEGRPFILARNATDPDLFEESARTSPRGNLILYAGSIAPRRGTESMVRALGLARRANPAISLRVLASRPHEDHLRTLRSLAAAVDLPLQLLIDVPRSSLDAHHAAAAVAFLPAEDAGYYHITDPLKLYDYMAAARPIVLPPLRTSMAIVREAGAGVVARSFDTESLADAVAEALRNAALLGSNGRKAALARHTWDHRADAILRGAHFEPSTLRPAPQGRTVVSSARPSDPSSGGDRASS
jgi:glycosyltransferase involved in cell wall biosynthesis